MRPGGGHRYSYFPQSRALEPAGLLGIRMMKARQQEPTRYHRSTVTGCIQIPNSERNQNDRGEAAGDQTQGQWLLEAPKVAPSA